MWLLKNSRKNVQRNKIAKKNRRNFFLKKKINLKSRHYFLYVFLNSFNLVFVFYIKIK